MFFENYEFYVDVQYTGLCVFMESIFFVIWYFSTVYDFIDNKESNGIFLAMFSQCYALSIPFYVFRLYCRSNKPSKLQILPYVEAVVWSEALPDTTTILANAMAVNIPD